MPIRYPAIVIGTGQAGPSLAMKLAATGQDHVITVWQWRFEDLADEACRRLSHNLTRAEWRQYVAGVPYRRTCPNLP